MSYFTKEDEIKIIKIIIGDIDLGDDDDFVDKLYVYYLEDMPYSVMKARDGDPYEWITERLIRDFDYLTTVVELTKEDLEK